MIELIQDLDNASSILHFALAKYLNACSAIQNYYKQAHTSQTLSNRIAGELILATAHEKKVKKARSIIAQSRNSFPSIVPISSLPAEILTRIFYLVVGSRPCEVRERSGEFIKFPKYPDYLSHVCSRWRQLAINTPKLWTHIDLVPYHSLSKGFEARASLLAGRAGSSLLDMHIYEPSSLREYDQRDMLEFLASIGFLMRSVEVVIPEASSELDNETLEVLECCFHNCEPGTLTKLTITDAGEMAPTFIEAAYEPDNVDGRWLRLAPTDLEDVLFYLDVLRLDGVYFHWTHPVYQKLIELRLTSSRKPGASIAEEELVNILAACPRLHVLHFGLQITQNLAENTSPTWPVRMAELEVLNLTSMEYSQVGSLLRLLAPGSKPLQLSIRPYDQTSSIYGDEIIKFIERSNVTKFYMQTAGWKSHREDYSNVDELLALLPGLQFLALADFHWSRDPFETVPPHPVQHTLPENLSLDTLYMLDCVAQIGTLRQALMRLPVKIVVLWDCRVWDEGTKLSDQEVKIALSRVRPIVRILKGGSSPVEDWDWD